jgi:uncharacterized protein YidB (DUF937 family)
VNRLRKWWPLAVAGVAAAIAITAATGVMAQTPVPGDTGVTFLDRVAQKLGISSDTLRTAVQDSANEQIDARVASGELTQAQADALKQRIANAPDEAFGEWGEGRGPGFGRGGFGMAGGAELANFLGITADQLRTQLQADGATLASVAQASGKTRDELKAFMTDQLRTSLDQKVADGRFTQAEADQKLTDFTSNLDPVIDATPPMDGPGMHGGRGMDGGFGAGGDM